MADPTSGDWTWRTGPDGDGVFYVEGTLGALAVVFAESRTPAGRPTGVLDDEGEANARLMAASPKLAAALRGLLAAALESGAVHPNDAWVTDARAALERAGVRRG